MRILEEVRGGRMKNKSEDKFALLIDADNVAPKYIEPILGELSKYGTITYKRIYGDWTNTQHAQWKSKLLTNSISPIQQFGYTVGKNATDSAMIIDAMDILYTNSVDGFCIVSSDSDFTKLASRLRESGMQVIGMGENKTPEPFRRACDVFTSLNLLIEESEPVKATEQTKTGSAAAKKVSESVLGEADGVAVATGEPAAPSRKGKNVRQLIPRDQIEEAVVRIITANENNGKETALAEIGSRLVKIYPDFDARSYGYSLLHKFLEEFTRIKLVKNDKGFNAVLNQDIMHKRDVEEHIVELVRAKGAKGILLSDLNNQIRKSYPDFKASNYGYAQFRTYLKSITTLEISKQTNGSRALIKL